MFAKKEEILVNINNIFCYITINFLKEELKTFHSSKKEKYKAALKTLYHDPSFQENEGNKGLFSKSFILNIKKSLEESMVFYIIP